MENEKGEPRQRIAVIGVPEEIKQHIIDDYRFFNDPRTFNETNFTKFDNISHFNAYIRNNSYGDEDGKHKQYQICFGI